MYSNPKNPTLNNKCTLVSVELSENDYGEVTETEILSTLWCAEFPVMSNEFYNARENGIKAQKLLCVHTGEYKGQLLVDYQGKRYSIYRIFPRSDLKTELYCAERIGNG